MARTPVARRSKRSPRSPRGPRGQAGTRGKRAPRSRSKPKRPRRDAQPPVLLTPTGTAIDQAIAREIREKVGSARHILVLGHERPDGDCMGSTVALGAILRELGHKATVIVEPGPKGLAFLNGHRWVHRRNVRLKPKPDLVFVLDTTERDRVGGVSADRLEGATLVNIDHHFSNEHFGDLNWVDAGAAATGELIWRLAADSKWPVPRVALDGLYTALVTDTGQFAYSNTTAVVMRMAAELIEAGVDPEDLWRRIYLNKSRAELELEARARNSLEVWAKGRICAISLTQDDFLETRTRPEMTQEFPGIPRALAGAKLAVFFYAIGGGEATKVSIRSVREIDACKLAQRFGGGGHRQAAGCTIVEPMRAAKELFRPAAIAAVQNAK